METVNKEITQQNDGKSIAIIAYLTIIGLIIAYVMNTSKKDDYAAFHIKQSLGLAATGIALGLVGLVPILGWLINIIGFFVLLYMWVMGLMNAINNKRSPVPFLGEKFNSWFNNL